MWTDNIQPVHFLIKPNVLDKQIGAKKERLSAYEISFAIYGIRFFIVANRIELT